MTWWACGLGLLVTGLYAGHVRSGGFVYEDARWQAARAAPVVLGSRRMLTRASWALTPTARAAHGLSVALHLIVVGLLGVLAWRLGYSPDGVRLVALVAAVHPLTVEAVAYAAARGEVIAAIGILLAVIGAAGRWWRPWPLAGMVAGAGIGWLGKESAVVLLALVPLTIWVTGRRPPAVAWGYGVVLLWLGLVGAWTMTGLDSWRGLLTLGAGVPGWSSDVPAWVLLQAAATSRLLGVAVSGVGMTVDPDLDLMPWGFRVFALVVLAGVAEVAWRVHRTRPLVTYGLTWTLLSLVPRFIVQTPRGYLNEHQFYVPLLGLMLAGVAWWDGWAHQETTCRV